MGDYPITELLTRTIDLERMKELSVLYMKAKEQGDQGLLHAVSRERQELKEQYLKVVHSAE